MLVLVHGVHGDWRHWLRNIEALAAAHTLWLPDLPGFGASDPIVPDAGHWVQYERADEVSTRLTAWFHIGGRAGTA